MIGFANSAWNPIVYCFFSKKFRQGFKSAFICCKKRTGTGKMNENKHGAEMKQRSTDSARTQTTDYSENSSKKTESEMSSTCI